MTIPSSSSTATTFQTPAHASSASRLVKRMPSTHFQRSAYHVPLSVRIEEALVAIDWKHVSFKTVAYLYIILILWMTWFILPLPGHWGDRQRSGQLPHHAQDLSTYFNSFIGFPDCHISATDLYTLQRGDKQHHHSGNTFCPNRKALLQALSDGGRVGFDAPYIPRGCHYQWYSAEEICAILERFDGFVFIGDSFLQTIYDGLNILLRQDLANGALQTWTMSQSELEECKCQNQFIGQNCISRAVTSSKQISSYGTGDRGNEKGSYKCQRTPHTFIQITSSKVSVAFVQKFKQVIPSAPRSNYKSIPIIYSISPSTVSHGDASSSLLEVLDLAVASKRSTPILWIGPTAAGHIDIKGRKGNQEIWDFDRNVAQVARKNNIEILGMWNATVQASSWDGIRYGQEVAITQAMMVLNWLGRLESS